jgi:predicted ATPase/DNA-binding winged helix-turn-helix (wHTH) protein
MQDSPQRFGNFEWRPNERQLLRDGAALPLGARAYDVLAALIERRDRTVSKSELFDIVWPDLVVEENNLQVQVSGLRKLLGAQAIATIPGRGYRFTLPSADQPTRAAPDAAPQVGQQSSQPPAAGRLIGRDADLSTVIALLQEHAVLTIVGAGGIGKTRLAHAAMARADALYPDGRWWVELAALNDASLIPATIATALVLALPPGRPPLDALATALAARRGLLVLDNCEHLADGAAGLVDVLRARAPGVRLLVTSQESLKCTDEHVFRLGSLALPPPQHADGVTGFGAVDLFVERARAVAPSFQLASDNVGAVVDICRRLDGIPLAIELAAARVPMLGVQGLHARLNHMFSLLTGVSRVTLRRHQTLRAALEWSHDLLSGDERALLRRLGVFNGGFALEMAQQVASDDHMDEWQVLDLLGQLIDKSLVIVEGDDAAPRYRLLEPTRAFALEQLAAAGESAAWLDRHARAVLDWATRFDLGRWTQPTAERFSGARELGNLRAAIEWALRAGGDRSLAYALLGQGWGVFQVGGALNEGLSRMRALWPPPRGLAVEVEALYCLALVRSRLMASQDEFLDYAQRALSLLRELGNDREHLADAVLALASLLISRGKDTQIPLLIAEAESLLAPGAPWRQQAFLAVVQGSWGLRQGDLAAGAAGYRRQAECYRRDGSEFGGYLAQTNLCLVLLDAGEIDEAIAAAREVVDGLQRMKAPYGMALARAHLATGLALRGGADDDVLTHAREAFELLRTGDDTHKPLLAAALHHARCGDATRAAALAGYAWTVRARMKVKPCPVDVQLDEQLQALIGAACPPDTARAGQQAGSAMGEAQIAGVAFEGAPLPGCARQAA